MNTDERFDALKERLAALTLRLVRGCREVEALRSSCEALRDSCRELNFRSEKDGENIRALARIAEIHHLRLSALEKSQDAA